MLLLLLDSLPPPTTRAGLLVAICCAVLAASPSDAGPRMVAVHRFASGPDAAGGDSLSVGDDTRTVLFSHPAVRVPAREVDWTVRDGRRFARVVLPEELSGARSVVATPNVVVGFSGRSLETSVVLVEAAEGAAPTFELTLPADAPKDKRIGFTLRAVPAAAGLEHATPVTRIPARAVLEFGFGLLELAGPDGPVRFEVELCEAAGCQVIFSDTAAADARGFHNRSVSLASYAGRRASFRFRAAGVEPGVFFGLPVWSDPALFAPAPGGAKQEARSPLHNVVMISLDTLAAKHVGAYGYARDTSPFMDAWFGEGGTIFERCFTAATTTGPSHMTLMTALQPSAHGVHGRTYYRALPKMVPTLALTFAQAGYATGAVTENGPMGAYRGFSRGFGSYAENKSAAVSAIHGHVETTFEAGRAWLERSRDKRFFLFLHTFQVHAPFEAPDAYAKLFAGDGKGGALEERAPPKWRAVHYDREIRYTDDVVRRFVLGLERDGLLEDTIVVVLSDHGEEFGEHDLLGHGAGIHEEVLHVPLMFRGPGIPAGRRVDAPVSHLDFMPTLLELAGVPGEAPGAGRSYASLLTGRGKPAAEVPIFSEAWAEHAFRISGGKFERIDVESPILVVRQGHRKLVRYSSGPPGPRSPRRAGGPAGAPAEAAPQDVYFDLKADPGETDPKPATGPEAQDLRGLLDDYERETRATRDLLLGATAEAPGAPLDAERREKLRALGYLE